MQTTREQVQKLRNIDPEITQTVMADLIGVSKERVRQLLIELELPTVPERWGTPE